MPTHKAQPPLLFPIVYRKAFWRQFLHCIGAALVAAPGLIGLVGAAFMQHHGTGDVVFTCIIGLVFTLPGAGIMAAVLRYQVTLEPDAISVRTLWGTRHLRREQIAGCRKVQGAIGPPYLVIFSKTRRNKEIRIPKTAGLDARFELWLKGVSDLDAVDRARAQAAIITDTKLGVTPDERLRNLTHARHIAGGLSLLTVLFGCWFLMFPHPYEVLFAALACFPPAAMALLAFSRGEYRLDDSSRFDAMKLITFTRAENLPAGEDPRATILTLVSAPGLILAIRAFSDLRLLHGDDWAIFAAFGVILCIALLIVARQHTRLTGVVCVGYLMFMCAWGFGAGLLLNASFDWAPTELYRTKILAKSIQGGKIRSYSLRVAPWGPQEQDNTVPVSDELFDDAQVGKTACVALHKGLFGVRWYAAAECDADAKPDEK